MKHVITEQTLCNATLTNGVLLTKRELSCLLKYSVSYINKLMRYGKIPFLKVGKSVRFILSEVVAALKKGSSV